MGKSLRSSQVVGGLSRGAWTSAEDKTLIDYVKSHREGRWSNVAKVTGLRRCGKSCRLRWMNYLRPDIKRGNITLDEEELILRLHKLLGNRWALIAGRLPGRTDNEIKNYWNTHLAKKAQDQSQSDLFTVLPSSRSGDPPPPPIAAVDLRSAPPQDNNYDQSFLAPAGPALTSPGAVINAVECESSDRSSCGGDADESQPFMIDFSIDDIYQILDPDFARFDGGAVLCDGGEEGQRRHDHDHAGSDPDIRSLASFLESEEWLGDGGDEHANGGACREDERVGA